jgi:membrane-bound lytic murein transglycosylase D
MRARHLTPLFLLLLAMPWVAQRAHAGPAGASVAIPEPPELEPDVHFWMRVYSEVTTNEGFIHDARNLAVVYESLRFEPGLPPAQRQQQVNAAREHYQQVLRRLAAGDAPLPGDEPDAARVRAMWGDEPPARLGEAADEVRFQLGQADRFRAGLVRAGAWEKHIARTLAAQGIPPEIAVLPHVESSFQPEAYSKAGAAGMWQFIRSTGRRFLRIDRVVDERLDPYRSSEAAAQLLSYNYSMLGSWPLAITAYNHGAGGMRRARDLLGTDDIVRIVRDYRSPSFGFASRNYYASFLAALRLDRDPDRFFGPLQRLPESASGELSLPAPARIDALERALGVRAEALRELNPALRPPVWSRQQPVPRGYHLRLPAAAGMPDSQQLLARLTAPAGTPALNPVAAVAASGVAAGNVAAASASAQGVAPGPATGAGVSLPPLARASSPTLPQVKLPAARPRRGAKAAPVAVPEPGPEPMPAPANVPRAEPVHVVLAGESVTSIAVASGIEPERLLRLNSLTLDDRIYEGQQLLVGEVAAASSDAAEEALAAADDRRDEAQATAVLAAERSAPALSAEQALAQGPRLSPAPAAQAVADPIDYGVQANDSVQVAAAETIGHYADWLGLTAAQVRSLNNLSAKAGVRVGQRLVVEFSQATRAQFERRRRAYHAQLQSAYFATHRIESTEAYAARAGDSLWQISRRAGVPDWLLQQYNPDVDFGNLRPGTALQLPKVEEGN